MTKLGKYELHEIIGKGGFGTVYRATDLSLGRVVAVKVLHPQWAVDPAFIERFSHEARVLASLEHPNIVWVSDAGEDGGRYYLAERYLPGGSLADRLKTGALGFEEARRILEEVCAGLQELHRQGWVHRDLKPANILFDAAGRAVITDFGLARAMAASGMSGSSSVGGAGTPYYRAPELWRGKPPASPATDVYSLGCILGEMLTGRPLFNGDTPDEVLTKHLIDGPDFGEPWPPEGVPAGMAGLVGKALQRAPAQRYADAQSFAQALAGISRVQEEALQKAGEEAAEQARLAAEENARQIAAERENARLAAEENARQIAAERENARLAAAALARQQAAEQPPHGHIPWWGWLGGGLLGLAVLGVAIFLVVAAVQGLLNGPKPATLPPTQAPVIVPTTAPTVAPTAAPVIVPTAAPTIAPTAEPTAAPTADPSVLPPCTTAGQTWVSPVDGMTLVCVPAGKFSMGSDDGYNEEKPFHEVTLDAYWMDQTEVTNEQYAQCVAAGKCTAPQSTGSYSRDSYYGNASFNEYPVIYVDWNQAAAYCAWAGRGLPTEAQWEKAARGTDGRKYPWGDNAPGTNLANYKQNQGDTTVVGSYPAGASPYGALDMAGNVWEWVADWYGPYPSGEQSNPTGPATGEYRVLRGGCWYGNVDLLRSSSRYGNSPDYLNLNLGFRCARSLP